MIRRALACLLALSLITPSPLFAATAQDLKNDLAYYEKTSRQNRLDSNDRLYILHRLRNKYDGTGVSIAAVERLIRLEEDRKNNPQAARSPATNRTSTSSASQGPLALKAIRRVDKSDRVEISLDLTASVAPQASRLVDPQRPDSPLLRVDLPGAQNGLKDPDGLIEWEDGPVASASASELPGGKGVRVQLEFRGDPTARVIRSDRRIVVEVKEQGALSEEEPEEPEAPTPTGTYQIQPGDILNIQIAPATELSQETVVQPDGTLVFPLVGTLNVRDMTAEQLERTLAQKLRPYVSRPKVTISIKQFSNRNVFIMGRVTAPGPVPFKNGLRLISAVSSVGGFSEDANRKAVKIYRGKGEQKKSFEFNAQEILESGDLSKDLTLQAGDLIEVQRGGNAVSVLGQVMKPGLIPYRDGMMLLDVFSEAGGTAFGANSKRVRIFRHKGDKRESIHVNLAHIIRGHPEDDVPVYAGDIVIVPQKSVFFGTNVLNSVVLPWLSLGGLVLALVVASRD